MINLKRLEGFYWVARTGGFAAAARASPRGITQPAIHQQVRKLEEELAVDLVERVGHRRMRLTPAGTRLYETCRGFFDALPETLRSMRDDAAHTRLRIDAAGLVLRALVPGWVQRLRQHRPDLRVALEEHQTPDFERLRAGDADVVVDFLPNVPADLSTKRVATAHAFVVVPSGHPLAARGRFEPKLLADTPLVAYPPSLAQHALQLAAVERHIGTPPQVLAASSVDIILSFVAAGLGYSLIPWLDEAGPVVDGVVAMQPGRHGRRFPIVAAWSPQSPIAKTITSALKLLPPPPQG